MQLGQILSHLDTISPFELAESWDNVGLIIGSCDDDIQSIVLSLEIDQSVIQASPANALLITHHPLIFGKLDKLDFAQYPSMLIAKMMQKNLKHIALHTNFDKTHLNKFVAKNILKANNISQENFICYASLNKDQYFSDFLNVLHKLFNKSSIAYVTNNDKKIIKNIALTTGAGASLLTQLRSVDCFLTADLKYHDAMLAKAMDISLVDIGHFNSEIYFVDALKPHLSLPKFNTIKLIIANSKNPFCYSWSQNHE